MRNDPPSTTRRVRSSHESRSATVRAAAAAPSRRQRSHWQREQQQQRMLFLAIGSLVAVIALIFAGGLIYDNVVRANQVVAQIGPDSVTATQLLDEVRPQARALDAQAKQLGNSQNITDYLAQQKRAMPDQVLNTVIDDHIIQQEADRRGISVSQSEVDDKERQTVADFQSVNNPSPTPQPTPSAEASPTDTSATSETALTSATPAPTALPVAAAASSPATPTTPTTPTAVPTLDETAYGSALQDLLNKNTLTEADLRTQLTRNILRDKVQTAVGAEQVPDTQLQIHLAQIQVASADQANDLLTQLQAGADFAALAQQSSTDTASKTQGGDMGWVYRGGSLTKALEDAAFALQLQPGQLSDVIQDTSGFHILKVLEVDPARQVPASQLTTQRQTAFNNWLSTQRSGSTVNLSLDQSEKDWVLARVGVRP